MARIRAPLGLLVYPVGWGGNYNPSLDPIVPMEAPPLTYDHINGRRTTASILQQDLRENYPMNWTGGIGRISRIPRRSLGQGFTTDDVFSSTTTSSSTVTPVSVEQPIDTSQLPVTSPGMQQDLSAVLTAELANNPSASPTSSQLQQVIQQGTGSGLTAAQISQIFANAASAGVSVFKATSSPYAIPGTSLVYNPATGQIANALTGLTGTQTIAGIGGVSIGMLALIGIALVVFVMVSER